MNEKKADKYIEIHARLTEMVNDGKIKNFTINPKTHEVNVEIIERNNSITSEKKEVYIKNGRIYTNRSDVPK